jgi:uncharacterized protein
MNDLLRLSYIVWLCASMGGITLAPIGANAIELHDLYEVKVPVKSRESEQRMQAFKQALITVMTRITGNRNINSKADVAGLLESPSRYIQQYRYLDAEGDASQLILWVRFDGGALERRLAAAGLPVWGTERPVVLIWLAIQGMGQRYLVGEDKAPIMRDVMQTTAKERGITLIFPLLDLEDQNRVNIADVIGEFDNRVRQASARYPADVIVVGRATALNDGYWRAHWSAYFGDQKSEWTSGGNLVEQMLSEGIHKLTDILSGQLAIHGSGGEDTVVALEVDKVDTLEDYVHLRTYLTSLSQVQWHRPYRIESNRVSLWLKLRGNIHDLERLIHLGDSLEKLERQPFENTPTTDSTIHGLTAAQILRYQLVH